MQDKNFAFKFPNTTYQSWDTDSKLVKKIRTRGILIQEKKSKSKAIP
jgi:hypothetical protein